MNIPEYVIFFLTSGMGPGEWFDECRTFASDFEKIIASLKKKIEAKLKLTVLFIEGSHITLLFSNGKIN